MRIFDNQIGQAECSHAGVEDGEVPAGVTAANTIQMSDDIELE